MLIIGRRTSQKIIIDDNIEITILEIGRNRVRFGIEAPKEVSIQTKLQSLPEQNSKDETNAPPLRAMAARHSSGGKKR